MADEYDDYDDYDEACERMQEKNKEYLKIFDESLTKAGLSDKTINRHLSNIDFYLNTYLLTYDVHPMEDGCTLVDDFLGYFFIKKCMWSTPATIKENIASLKKFYKCMLDNKLIAQESYDALLAIIKECKDEWIETCEEYNDVSDVSPFGNIDSDLFGSIYDSVAKSLGLDSLLGIGSEDEDLSLEDAIDALTLGLLYLTAKEEGISANGEPIYCAKKALDGDALTRLHDNQCFEPSDDAESLTFTKYGLSEAEEYLEVFGLGYLL